MRILFLTKGLRPDNVIEQPWAHIHQLESRFRIAGESTSVISYGGCDGLRVTDSELGNIYSLGGRFRLDSEEFLRVAKQIDPEVINWYSGLLSSRDIAKISKNVGSKIVWNITQRRILPGESYPLRPSDIFRLKQLAMIYSYSFLPDFLVRRAVEGVRAVVVPSRLAETSLMKMGIPQQKIHRISSGVDSKLFSRLPTKEEIRSARESNGLNEDDFVLCYFGSISSFRGFDTVLDAFSILTTEIPDARLLVLARSQGRERSISNLSKRSPYMKVVTEILEPDDIVRLLMASDVVVLPFRFWPMNECPLTILEGMAAGKVVITTPVGFAEDVIVNGVNGFLVRPGDSVGIADLLKELARDEKRRTEIGNAARELVLRDYNWDRIAQRTLDLFRRI